MAGPIFTLTDTWLLNNRVNLKLLDQLSEQQLNFTANPRARNIADQLAHLHNVRIMWLEVMAPALAKTVAKIPKGDAGKQVLRVALEASAAAMARMLEEAEKTGKMKAYKRGPAAFLGYALAHEANHRGQIILHLKNAKMPIDKIASFGLWEWEKI